MTAARRTDVQKCWRSAVTALGPKKHIPGSFAETSWKQYDTRNTIKLCVYTGQNFFFRFVLSQRVLGRATRRFLPGFTWCLQAGEQSNSVNWCLLPPLSSLLFAVEKNPLGFFFFSSSTQLQYYLPKNIILNSLTLKCWRGEIKPLLLLFAGFRKKARAGKKIKIKPWRKVSPT